MPPVLPWIHQTFGGDLTVELICISSCMCAPAELMVGGSLSDAMRMHRTFTLRRAMEVAVDTARGLAYLHAKKNGAIIHRRAACSALPLRCTCCCHHPLAQRNPSNTVDLLSCIWSCMVGKVERRRTPHDATMQKNPGAACMDEFLQWGLVCCGGLMWWPRMSCAGT